MAEHHFPEFDEALTQLSRACDEWREDLRDFNYALTRCEQPEEIIDVYESRRLLRRLSEDVTIQ